MWADYGGYTCNIERKNNNLNMKIIEFNKLFYVACYVFYLMKKLKTTNIVQNVWGWMLNKMWCDF